MDKELMGFRRCFLEPAPEIYEAAEILNEAVNAHNRGDHDLANNLIIKADMPAVTTWVRTIKGPQKVDIHRYRPIENAPPNLSKEQRDKKRMPTAAEKREIIKRDGHICRFCGIPVIDLNIRKKIGKVYPQALRWGNINDEKHSAFECMELQFDHVLPHSRGGLTTIDNVLITCSPCNYGRGEYTIEEVGIIDPRTLPIQKSDWNGLEHFKP